MSLIDLAAPVCRICDFWRKAVPQRDYSAAAVKRRVCDLFTGFRVEAVGSWSVDIQPVKQAGAPARSGLRRSGRWPVATIEIPQNKTSMSIFD